MKNMPKEFETFKQHLSQVPREEMEDLIASLWLRFNVEEADDGIFLFNPDKEVGGADLVEWVSGQVGDL